MKRNTTIKGCNGPIKKHPDSPDLSRRRILHLGCTAGAGALMIGSGACGAFRDGQVRSTPNQSLLAMEHSEQQGHVSFGIFHDEDMGRICERIIPQVTDLRWLSNGDSVLIKVACNSGNEHPAVTSPSALRALVAYFQDHGAGRVIVGDQSGVEHVRLTQEGRVRSTRELMEENGLVEAINESGAELHCFDDQNFEEGYFQPTADFDHHWGDDLWFAGILQSVDHVVYLPRLSTHAVAGYTCGIKNAVGWLRDDSRGSLHQRGDVFFERIAELNHFSPLRDKLRFTLTLGEKALLDIGPDMGGEYDFEGAMALASCNLVDHDCLASALLPWLDEDEGSFYDIYSPYPDHVNHFNRRFVEETWGEETVSGYREILPYRYATGLEFDVCLSHLATLQNYRPRRIVVQSQAGAVPENMLAYLSEFGDGLFDLESLQGNHEV